MKNLNFVTGFLAATCLFLLISATTRQSQNAEVPRYHITNINGEVTIYDAVTGEMEIVTYNKVNDDSNLRELIERGR